MSIFIREISYIILLFIYFSSFESGVCWFLEFTGLHFFSLFFKKKNFFFSLYIPPQVPTPSPFPITTKYLPMPRPSNPQIGKALCFGEGLRPFLL